MWPLTRPQQYQSIAVDDDDALQFSDPAKGVTRQKAKALWRQWPVQLIALAIVLFAAAASLHAIIRQQLTSITDKATVLEDTEQDVLASNRTRCSARREWRTLNGVEQQAYISAVLCLREQESVLTASNESSAYDDFPWIHSHVGYHTHNSAPFLPWHRYFLHIYETTLREKCDYEGGLVFWDWTLDSDALEKSPVFDAQTGFGGDGEVNGEITVGRSGRCVQDGPFAGVNVSFYDVKYNPHCLSRGFRDQEGNLGHMNGNDISPTSIDEVLKLDKYEAFVALMESRVHDAIPFGIGGDFETFTAPYDPVFFLHHTQLDRLWWLWQQGDEGARLNEYGGHKQRHSVEMASLDDDLTMKALAPSIKVSQLMDTEGEMLCYRY